MAVSPVLVGGAARLSPGRTVVDRDAGDLVAPVFVAVPVAVADGEVDEEV
jgi:hypothetical protein